jgi:hypothetical protein
VYWALSPEAATQHEAKGTGAAKGCWCHQCYSDAKGERMNVMGMVRERRACAGRGRYRRDVESARRREVVVWNFRYPYRS